jgi:hypothetical protein
VRPSWQGVSIVDDLVFPSHAGTVIKPDNIFPRYTASGAWRMQDCAGSVFMTYGTASGNLLIQHGAWLAYIKEQMGHSSIQITVEGYGHLIPGTTIACVDRLDTETTQHQSAPGTHQARKEDSEQRTQAVEDVWLPPKGFEPPICIQIFLACGSYISD